MQRFFPSWICIVRQVHESRLVRGAATRPPFHKERPLNWTFYEDSVRHDAFGAVFEQPTLIFQGLRDASVDYHSVEAFARIRRNAALSLLDNDHPLIASLPRMWHDIEPFFGFCD